MQRAESVNNLGCMGFAVPEERAVGAGGRTGIGEHLQTPPAILIAAFKSAFIVSPCKPRFPLAKEVPRLPE